MTETINQEEKGFYFLPDFNPEVPAQGVQFMLLNEDGTRTDGTTIEAVISVALARVQFLNGKFPCRENALAITKLEEALMWLNKRTEDRKSRGVEGQHTA